MNIRQTIRLARELGFRPAVAGGLLALHMLATLLESIGLTILLPVFEFVRANGDVAQLTADSRVWPYILAIYNSAGIPLSLTTLLAASFTAILGRQCIVYVKLLLNAWAQNDLAIRIRNAVFERFLAADAEYHDANPAGVIISDLTVDLQRAVSAIFSLLAIANHAIMATIYTSILLTLSAGMTIGAICAIAAGVMILRRLFSKTTEVGRMATETNQRLSEFLLDRLRHVRLIRLSGTEAAECAQMDSISRRQGRVMVVVADLMARVEVIVEPVVVAVCFVLLYMGVATFGLQLEQIGLFLVIVIRLLPVMKEGLRTRQSILSASGSLEMLKSRMAEMSRSTHSSIAGLPLETMGEGIRFSNVSFRYAGARRDALHDVSLLIPAGKMTALVGPSGSGKSTLIDMLPRLRSPQSGSVTLAGHKIEAYDLASLRASIAYAPQSPQIFNVTAAQHIRYGRADATIEEIREVCRIVSADEFLEGLPQGYDTLLGSDGLSLSGGQRQRLDLARALIKRTKLLILDEPTANLDADSEQKFQEILGRLHSRGDVTIIVIAHRFSTITQADQIVVLDNGRVAEAGAHGALLKANGWYAGAFAKQQLTSTLVL